jgi:hypothetical protein
MEDKKLIYIAVIVSFVGVYKSFHFANNLLNNQTGLNEDGTQ